MNKKSQEDRRSGITSLLQGAISAANPGNSTSSGNRVGLSSLVQGAVRPNSMVKLTLDQIEVRAQPRKHFDPDALQDLAFSLKTQGQQVPVVVRLRDDRFELVSGERRYRAAKLAGLNTLDAVVRDLEDHEHHRVALLENLHRKDLNVIEETTGLLDFLQVCYGLERAEATKELRDIYNTSRSTEPEYTERQQRIMEEFRIIGRLTVDSFVQNRLPLLTMPEVLIDLVATGKLFERQARKLARVKDENLLSELLDAHFKEGVPFEEIEDRIKRHLSPPAAAPQDDGPSGETLSKQAKTVFATRKISKLPADKRSRLQELLNEAQALLE